MSKFRDFITAAVKGAEAFTETAVGTVFDKIEAAAKSALGAVPTLQADVLKLASDARHNLLTLAEGLEEDTAAVIADGVDEVTTVLANRAELLDTPEKFEQFGSAIIAQVQAWMAQKHVGIDPAKPASSS